MGRCLAFNLSPSELKEKMKDLRYFVYSPDFDGAAGGNEQYFFAVVDLSRDKADSIIQSLVDALDLKLEGDNYIFTNNSIVTFVTSTEKLYIKLRSRKPHAAVSESQIDDVKRIDECLVQMKLKPFSFTRYQDVVFGENHFLAKELSKPFKQPGALFVPNQKDWFVGKSYEEANTLFEKSQKK